VSGIATGAIYASPRSALPAVQAAGVINFAQGEFVMLPAFAMLLFVAVGAPLWLAFLLACAAAMLVLGWGFKRVVVDPLIRHGVIPLVIATLGLSIGLKSALKAGYSAEAHPFTSPFPAGQFALAGVNISYADVGTLLTAGRSSSDCSRFSTRRSPAARWWRSRRTPMPRGCSASTSIGWSSTRSSSTRCWRSLRHCSSLPPISRNSTWAIRSAEGLLRRDHRRVQPDARRALGGVLIGVLENLVGYYVSPAYKEGVALMLFLVVILFRPEACSARPRSARYECRRAASGQ
jgi:branched-chain amino acid transport system permease protein